MSIIESENPNIIVLPFSTVHVFVILIIRTLHRSHLEVGHFLETRSLSGFGVLQVEPTDHCNLACGMCRPHAESWSQIHAVPKGFLSYDLWCTVVDGFLKHNVCFDHVIFQWLGDPLFHPRLHDIIAQGQRLKGQVGYLRVDSNMILLDESRTESILTGAVGGVPLLLVASIDAFSPSVYKAVKGFDRLQVVRQNLRRLLRRRKTLQAPINLQLQFVVQKGNAHEVLQFKQYWIDVLTCYGTGGIWHDEIMFKRLSVDGGGKGQRQADELYEKSVLQHGVTNEKVSDIQIQVWQEKPWQQSEGVQSTRSACPALWSTPVIRHDGQLMLCCADLEGQMSLGSLFENDFVSLWLSDAARTRRREHLNGVFSDKCAQCGGVNWYDLPKHYREWV